MKEETIKALAEKLKPTSREEFHQVAQAMAKVDRFPEIDSMELARLVEMRMRKKGALSSEEMVNEIESTIDMVQACEFMLAVRRLCWRADERQIKETIYGTPEPTEKEKAIYAESYPLKFNTGLTRMGVPAKDQEWKFEQFFRVLYPQWRWREMGRPGLLKDFIEAGTVTSAEVTAAFEKLKIEGWDSAFYLGNVYDHWVKWWQTHKHDAQKLGGQRSAEKRAEKTAKKKGQLKPKVRSVGKSGR